MHKYARLTKYRTFDEGISLLYIRLNIYLSFFKYINFIVAEVSLPSLSPIRFTQLSSGRSGYDEPLTVVIYAR